MSITTSMPQSNFLLILDPITQTMPTWFQEGGVVMWPLLLISFLITVVALERLYFWVIYHNQKERFLLQECFAALYNKQRTEALLVCQKLETPALKMISEGISILPFHPKEKMLLDVCEDVSCHESQKGCFLSNVAVEFAQKDNDVAKKVSEGLTVFENGIKEAFEAGQAEGSISNSSTAEELAKLYVTIYSGLKMKVKSGSCKKDISSSISTFLKLF